MKKLTLLVAFTMLVSVAFSNGLLTNTNQSAQFIRMMSRNASLGIDGVYYNPAGLIKLDNGWYFSISSQTIFQTRTIDCKFPLLNNGNYEGIVEIPSFPTAFAVYKKDKLALSFGFGPNAGGGSAKFDRGLPSFEIPISKIVPALSGLAMINPSFAVSGYEADLTLDGSSVYMGFQLGASYEINEMLSVSAGVRYMPATNKYVGSIRDVQLKVGSEYYNAPEWLGGTAETLISYSQGALGAAVLAQPIIDAGGGVFTLAELEGSGDIDGAQRGELEGGLIFLGVSQDQIDAMNVTQIQGTYQTTGEQLGATATSLNGTASMLADKEVDTKQTGAGFTPILGLNFSPNENWNVGIRYEHKTYMTVENSTTVDDFSLFPDGEEFRADVPGILGVGVGYTNSKWEAQFSFNYYFDKYVSWRTNVRDIAIWKELDQSKIRERVIDKNSFDVALGLQFNATERLSLSTGVMYQKAGVADSYNSDFSFAPDSYVGLGCGIMWKITDLLALDVGVSYITYKDAEVSYFDPHVNDDYAESYGKESISFVLGLSYSLPF